MRMGSFTCLAFLCKMLCCYRLMACHRALVMRANLPRLVDAWIRADNLECNHGSQMFKSLMHKDKYGVEEP